MIARPRILFVGNFLLRHWGNGRTGIDMRLAAGATRLNLPHMVFSERDIARMLAPLGFMRNIGAKIMNARLVETARNFKCDVIFLAHCDYVTNEALEEIKSALGNVKIVHINCDPIATEHCCRQIDRRKYSCDAIFVTTAGDVLKRWCNGNNIVGFFPNPSDLAYDTEDNSQKSAFEYDLFFAGRPALADERKRLLDELLPRIDPSVKLGFFGMERSPLVVGRAYEQALANSKMGLSINRFEGWKWYSSDRITHLMANGILTFQNAGNSMQDFFSDNETVYFSDAAELADKISFFNRHDSLRMAIASSGRAKYNDLFNSCDVLSYMLETVLGEKYSKNYMWSSEVYR